MKYLNLLLLLLGSDLHADQWLCSEESSQRQNNVIFACGVGTGDDEDKARRSSFENAKNEFDQICNSSSDCKYHEVTVIPKRTSCEEKNGAYKCYRLIAYVLGDESRKPPMPNNTYTMGTGGQQEVIVLPRYVLSH